MRALGRRLINQRRASECGHLLDGRSIRLFGEGGCSCGPLSQLSCNSSSGLRFVRRSSAASRTSPGRNRRNLLLLLTFGVIVITLVGQGLTLPLLIRRLGVTRLSLGVENFDDRILDINGRAHRSPEIGRSYAFARSLGFPQINIDLIAGMLGETDENWRACVDRTLALDPDSVTIYQMELPYNTTISSDLLKHTGQFAESVATWATKRRWVDEAFTALERAGYHIGSAYTAVKNPASTKFVYRDRLWQGADLVGLGVASFGHVNGVHMQNLDTWEKYSAAIERDEMPLGRAYRPTDEERLIREFALQLKRGAVTPEYFAAKYDVDVLERFAEGLRSLADSGYLAQADHTSIALTRAGLLRVDVLLPRFFLPQHRGIRYT